MSGDISNVPIIIQALFVFSIVLSFLPLLIHQMNKPRGIDSVSIKITAIFTTTFAGISIALFTINYFFARSPLDTSGDVSNWATLVIEIGIGTAIGSAIFLYSRFQQKQSDEELGNVKKISTTLDDMMKDVKKTNDEQSKMIKEMKPIIEKQGKIIKKQEDKERIHIENILTGLRFNLESSKLELLQIKELLDKNATSIDFAIDHRRKVISLESNAIGIGSDINELFSAEIQCPREVITAQGKINVYLNEIRKTLSENKGNLENPPDPTEVIEQIDVALKKLPQPGPA